MTQEVSQASRRMLWRLFESGRHAELAKKSFALARRGQDVMHSFAFHPFEDEWLDCIRQSMNSHVQRCTGFVYAAANPVHLDLYKVGQTGKALDCRLKNLVKEGVFGHFELVHAIRVPDRFRAETRVHHKLTGVQRHKEFFKTPHVVVTTAMDHVLQEEMALLARLGLQPLQTS